MASLAACAAPGADPTDPDSVPDPKTPAAPRVNLHEFDALKIDRARWNYDEERDCYYQLSLPYCIHPATEAYEQLAIYVPGAYFDAEKVGRYWDCEPDDSGRVGSFSAQNAPIVMPLNSDRFAAQTPPGAYDGTGLDDFLAAGCIYVYAGFRGRSNGYDSLTDDSFEGGSPWGVCDIKAAIRFLRFNAKLIPGSKRRIVCFGHGAGGALACILGASGDAEGYLSYLEEIGAATHDVEGNPLSDAVYASYSWCPVLPVEDADAAYEWLMGQYGSDPERLGEGSYKGALSRILAASYGDSFDALGLVDEDGNALTLDETEGAIFASGSYYDYLLEQVEGSFDAFLAHAEFPLEIDLSAGTGEFPGGGPKLAEGESEEVDTPPDEGQGAKTYATLDAYLSELNADYPWITYDSEARKVRMASLGAFAAHCRRPALAMPAYDAPNRSLSANQLFGVEDVDSLHFDAGLARLLDENGDYLATFNDFDSVWPEEWVADLTLRNSMDDGMGTRRNLYNPLYFLSGAYAGFATATVARHWRIVTGVQQSETTLTGELNLARALDVYDDVESCEFEAVWDKGFVAAERTGSATSAFLDWLQRICK